MTTNMTSMGVRMTASPQSALLDDETLRIYVEGLDSQQDVRLTATVVENKFTFISDALYTANDLGIIDTTVQPSTGGSFTGVEPVGLLWSMKLAPGQRQGFRLLKRDVSQPLIVHLRLIEGHDIDEGEGQGRILAETIIHRRYLAEDVEQFPVNAGRLRGTLFLPPGDGLFPGVIEMFGTAGGLVTTRAALLASRGFAAFALAFFAYSDLPERIELNLEYFREAVDWLQSHPRVKKTGIGAVGVSKGAALAIQMSIMSSKVKAVVSINSFCCHAIGIHYQHGQQQPVVDGDLDKFYYKDNAMVYGTGFDYHAGRHSNAFIQIDKSPSAHFLFVVGEGDISCDLQHVRHLVNKLRRRHAESAEMMDDFEVLSYPGAGHLIEPPVSPLNICCYTKLIGLIVDYGGKTVEHAAAQRDSWKRILTFLRQRLDKPSADCLPLAFCKL